MENSSSLLLFYSALISIVIFIFAFLWWNTKVQYYRFLTFVMVSGTFSLVLASWASLYGPIFKIIAFSTLFVFILCLQEFIGMLLKIKFKKKKLIILFLLMFIFTLLLNLIPEIQPEILAIPMSIALAAPLIYMSLITIKKKWKDNSVPIRGVAITLFFAGLHCLDYPLVVTNETFVTIGFAIGIVMTFSLILFGFALIVETVSRDKTKLEVELYYKAILTTNAKLTALGEMAAGVAHEINNPLASILLTVEKMKRQLISLPNEDEYKKNLMSINQEVHQASYIVKSLLEFSREIEDLPLQEVYFEDLIKPVISLCQEKFNKRGIQLTINPSNENIKLSVRPGQITQTLLNLLNNSYEACKNSIEKWVQVDTYKNTEKTYALIVITDSGSGIKPEDRDKVFLPFYTTKTAISGVGLGLSVSKGLIEANGGRIFLDDKSNFTSFIIELPLAPSE